MFPMREHTESSSRNGLTKDTGRHANANIVSRIDVKNYHFPMGLQNNLSCNCKM